MTVSVSGFCISGNSFGFERTLRRSGSVLFGFGGSGGEANNSNAPTFVFLLGLSPSPRPNPFAALVELCISWLPIRALFG